MRRSKSASWCVAADRRGDHSRSLAGTSQRGADHQRRPQIIGGRDQPGGRRHLLPSGRREHRIRAAEPTESLVQRVLGLAVPQQHERCRLAEVVRPTDQLVRRCVQSEVLADPDPRPRCRPGMLRGWSHRAGLVRIERGVDQSVGVRVELARHPCVSDVAVRSGIPGLQTRVRISGCLIFHRPDICSTINLESSRTSTSASGAITGGGESGHEAAVLRDVVGGDADRL